MKKIKSSADVNEPKYLVRRRLNLVRKLTASTPPEQEADELIHADGQWYTHPGKDYQGLRCYLLLSCFDILGQLTTEWADFYSWLSQKMNVDPRTFVPVASEKDMAEPLRMLYHNYSKDHAVRNNFHIFINKVIGPVRREELLNSIVLIKKSKMTDVALDYIPTEEEKLNALLDLRSNYIPADKAIVPDKPGVVRHWPVRKGNTELHSYIVLQLQPSVLLNILEESLSRQLLSE